MQVKDIQENYGSGWIKIYRSIRKHWLWEDEKRFKAWITILLEVNHEPNKTIINGEVINCDRGQKLYSIKTWAKIFGKKWTQQKVKTFFKLLEKDLMIETKGLRKTTMLSVCNYDTYQNKQLTDISQITKRKLTDNSQITTIEELKNDKNVKKKSRNFVPPSFKEVNSYISEKNYKIDTNNFIDFYSSKGWMVGKNKMKDWRAAVRTWASRNKEDKGYEPTSSGNCITCGKKTNLKVGKVFACSYEHSIKEK